MENLRKELIMSKIKYEGNNKVALIVNDQEDVIGYMIFCPACKCGHAFYTNLPKPHGNWTFVNHDFKKPTFSPSMLVHANKTGEQKRCHSFVCDGKIQFLNDCEHELKGQTVELPEI